MVSDQETEDTGMSVMILGPQPPNLYKWMLKGESKRK